MEDPVPRCRQGRVMEKGKKATVIVHSGDLDKIMSAFIVGNGFLSIGIPVTLFFTFWGLRSLTKGGFRNLSLSRMNMLGLGKWMIRRKMKKAGTPSLERLMKDFIELGGRILACDMTMEIMGVKREDLMEELISDYCGVGTYLNEARDSKITLFI